METLDFRRKRLLTSFLVISVVFLSQQTLGCQDSPVGIADSSIIPDNRFTATSFLNVQYTPKHARLNGKAGWEPKTTTDPNDYLQIDLGETFVICAVATQGCSNCDEWTTQYKISTSIDFNSWAIYKDGPADKLFNGNADRNTVVKNVLDVPTLVRYVRVIPTGYRNFKVLRVEAYGLRKNLACTSLPIGIGNGKIPDSSMTSSSTYNSTTSPSKARLGYTAGSSWCAATSDSSPYLQINLGSLYIICGIATQGDHMTDQWIRSYHMQISTNGTRFDKYTENNQDRSFVGNFDSKTMVNNVLYDETIGQYIRVTPTSHYGTTNCMRTELFGIQQTGGCTSMAVGLSYSSMIPDHRFTASSFYDGGYIPSNGRLITSTKAWRPKTTIGAWLQIDLGFLVYVCAVATQGGGTFSSGYVITYKIKVSLDNVNWKFYQENNKDKVLTGNMDPHSIVINHLANPTKAKFIRFYPTAYSGLLSMRAEVYGISSACKSPFGLENPGVIQNDRMTSSSYLDNTHTASHGRLYGDSTWCSNMSSNTEYIQINLGQVMTVTGIATQGDHTMDKWVQTYTISYSMDGKIWSTYKAGLSSKKVLQGNSDRSSIVVRWLSHPLTARHVRVTPQTWNTAICMRMEVYGCNYATRPVISVLSNQNLIAAANSSVDLVCIVQEPLIQYIKWYTGNTDITSQSTGLVRGVNGIKSILRINYTSVDDVLNTYQCMRSDKVYCSKAYFCRAMYQNIKHDSDAIKRALVSIALDYPSILANLTVDNIESTSVTVRWTKPVLSTSQAEVTWYVLQYQTSSYKKTINVSSPAIGHVITGLKRNTAYSVKTKAVSIVGHGQWSLKWKFRTLGTLSSSPDFAASLAFNIVFMIIIILLVVLVIYFKRKHKGLHHVIENTFQEKQALSRSLAEEIEDHVLTKCRLESSLAHTPNNIIQTLEASLNQEKQRSNKLKNSLTTLQTSLNQEKQRSNELRNSLTTLQNAHDELRRSTLTNDWVLDRNEIHLSKKEIGRGAYGRVLEGEFRGCTVAVKVIHNLILSDHIKSLFEREMTIASRCRHPCLLQFIGATNNNRKKPLFVTELLDTSLKAVLGKRALISTEIETIALDVAKGLNYLHLYRPTPIIHRDISSGNVLLWQRGESWRAKVSDYGTANVMQYSMTANPGSPIYSAPEARTSTQSPKFWSSAMRNVHSGTTRGRKKR